MQRGGGLITADDLAGYRPIAASAVRGTYRGYDILACRHRRRAGRRCSSARTSWRTSIFASRALVAGRRAPDDRSDAPGLPRSGRYLGDPASTTIPDDLTDKAYARKLAATIDPREATPSAAGRRIALADESDAHDALLGDRRRRHGGQPDLHAGKRFGSRVVVPGGGFLLNDEMNDFNWLPGVTDRNGQIGTPPNQIAPRQADAQLDVPDVVVRRDGRPLLITGSPGGRTIINTVLWSSSTSSISTWIFARPSMRRGFITVGFPIGYASNSRWCSNFRERSSNCAIGATRSATPCRIKGTLTASGSILPPATSSRRPIVASAAAPRGNRDAP